MEIEKTQKGAVVQDLPNDMVWKTKPFYHQLDCVMKSRDKENFGILMEMGCGKSAVLIYTASYLFSQGKINGMVIICPKSATRTWSEQQLPIHMPDSIDMRIVTWGSQSKSLDNQLISLFQVEPLKLHVLVMNVDAVITDRGYDILERFLRGHDALLTIDESTSIKNSKSSRTKILTKLGKLAKYRRILTGTPVANRPMDIYAQFKFLEEGCLGISSWLAFRNRYAVTKTRYINGRKFEEIIGWQRLDELQKSVANLSYRVLKKDCLDLPEKIYQTRHIEMAPEQRKYYNDLRDLALAELASGTTVAAPLIITRILRLRQALCNLAPGPDGEIEFISDKDARLNEVMSIIEEAGDQKIIIWSYFTPSILKLVKTINEEYGEGTSAAFYGAVNPKERQVLINEFQDADSKLKILVANQQTGGESITLTKATIVVYHDHEWSYRLRQQSEDRAHRIGQTKEVTYIDLVASGTVDEQVVSALLDKKDLANVVTGDILRKVLTK